MIKTPLHAIAAAAFCAGGTLVCSGSPGPDAPAFATPLEPVSAVIDAFRSHRIVALGEGSHGNQQGHSFRLALIRDARFAAAVNDIVVEFGSARHQDLMDRYIAGDEVPDASLRRAWQDTTQADTIWDAPIYRDFFHAVRTVNASLPRERRLRVLLGDPPVDWDGIHTLADLQKWLYRDAHAADVIRREVIAKGRRALVIYGDAHFVRQENSTAGIVGLLEKEGISAFTIHTETRTDLTTLQPGIAAWPKPSLALIRGTPLAAEGQFDAILYLGPPSSITIAQLSSSLCSDGDYMAMRLRRMALPPPPPGAPFHPVDRLKQFCTVPDGATEIPDHEPGITGLIRQTLVDAALGKADPARIAPESRDRLLRFLETNGPRFLGPMGALESLALLVDTSAGGKRIRRYRAVFANGSIIWTVELSPAGTIVSLDPRKE